IKNETDKLIKQPCANEMKEILLNYKYDIIVKQYNLLCKKESDFTEFIEYLKHIYEDRKTSNYPDIDNTFYNTISQAIEISSNELTTTRILLKNTCNKLLDMKNLMTNKSLPFDNDLISRLNNDIRVENLNNDVKERKSVEEI